MLRLPFADEHDLPEALQAVRSAHREHGVVAVPTETFYGLAVPPDDPVAVATGVRPQGTARGEGASGGGCLDRAARPTGGGARGVARPPGGGVALPLTVILAAAATLPAGGETLAVRVPGHPLLRAAPRGRGAAHGHLREPQRGSGAGTRRRGGAAPRRRPGTAPRRRRCPWGPFLDGGGPDPRGAANRAPGSLAAASRVGRNGGVRFPQVLRKTLRKSDRGGSKARRSQRVMHHALPRVRSYKPLCGNPLHVWCTNRFTWLNRPFGAFHRVGRSFQTLVRCPCWLCVLA